MKPPMSSEIRWSGLSVGMRGPVDISQPLFRWAVGVGGGERELVVHRMHEPARGVGCGHPAAPLQDEIQRDVELDEEGEDRNRDQRHEHQEQLVPERARVDCVRNLNGVAERAVEEIEPDAERDLELIDEDQEEDVDARIEALAERHRRQRKRPDRDRRSRFEERVGERHHPAHEGESAKCRRWRRRRARSRAADSAGANSPRKPPANSREARRCRPVRTGPSRRRTGRPVW